MSMPLLRPLPAGSISQVRVNGAIIGNFADSGLAESALNALADQTELLLVSDNDGLLPGIGATMRRDFAAVGFDRVPIDLQLVRAALQHIVTEAGKPVILVVDMAWGVQTVSAAANFDAWGTICDGLAREAGQAVVSLYNRPMLIEDQLLAALRGHSHFVAPSGVYDNPFWLPPAYLTGASLSEQLGFLLARIVPDFAGMAGDPGAGNAAALGADPDWFSSPHQVGPVRGDKERWKIRCFGRLRIYTGEAQQIEWKIPGGAPRKAKALFAYLLQRGEKGAPSERICELLWPECDDEEMKRARLHHTVAMLRKTLGGADHVRRNGGYYRLVLPEGSWIDIRTFEQVCRRAAGLAKAGNDTEAMTMLRAAERLYTGELFEDLLPEYVESECEDWCLPQRAWLKDMALKVQRDMAVILRRRGDLRAALDCCRKALAMDPACEIVHEEAMRIFYAQGRSEAVSRQYRQYLSALAALGAETAHPPLETVFQKLSARS